MRFFVSLFGFRFIASCFFMMSVVHADTVETTHAKAVFAGGCFWCTESDFEKLDGVINAVSGYIGGKAETANYKAVTKGNSGHYEASQVIYDPDKISYSELVEHYWRHIDPTDAAGQFCDKGPSYRSAIFYNTPEEQKIVEKSLKILEKTKPFNDPIVTPLIASTVFYPAEDYHQNYYKKNPIRYRFYRKSCGRDKRVSELWDSKK